MFIEQPAIYLRWLYPKAYWRMDHHEKAVYLTFDDGPIPEATPFILDTLKAFGAKATFFMVRPKVTRWAIIPTTISKDSPTPSRNTVIMLKRPTPISKVTTYVRLTVGCAWRNMPG